MNRKPFVHGRASRAIAAALMAWGLAAPAHAEPVRPQSPDEVVETLPATAGGRAEERRLRRDWAANPGDPVRAVALARRYLAQAHEQADPRFAGQALAVLRAWDDGARAGAPSDAVPDDVLLALANTEQYLHRFDDSAAKLERVVQRRPGDAQAWLTLATVRRVQGRYDASDRACAGVATAGAALYAQACRAENDSLRGRPDDARRVLGRLIADPQLAPPTRQWLLTTLAETEARAGRAAPAEAAYRAARALGDDAYATLSYADFLAAADRPAEALALLRGAGRSDAVLLRLAILGQRVRAPGAERDVAEMRERIVLAARRPEARTTHARELAMFALGVDGDAARALELARDNVRRQREPLDLLIYAQAAHASGQASARGEVAALTKEMTLHDARIDALL